MKTIILLCAALVSAGTTFGATNEPPPPQFSDEHLGQLLQEAILLARVGLYDEAEQRCKTILAQRPDQATVKQLLSEIQDKQRQVASQVPGAELKRKLNDLIVPELNVREAAPVDVIEFLRTESKKLAHDKTEINFVWQVPADQKLPKITLNLKKVPMIDVIRYVTDLAKLSYRVDPHAVIIYVPEKATPPPAPSDVKSQ